MTEERFDTGMTHREATKKARKWWSEFRGVVRREFNTSRDASRVKAGTTKGDLAAPALVIPGEAMQEIPSGILSGYSWRRLSRRERGMVVAHWHHYQVRVPHQSEAMIAPSGKILLN